MSDGARRWSVEQWCNDAAPYVERLLADQQLGNYGGIELRRDLARRVANTFPSAPALAQAAFLRGASAPHLREWLPISLLDPSALAIVEGWERLATADVRAGDVSRRLLAEVLPSLGDVRAALLFVWSALDELDGDGRFSRWLAAFQQGKSVAPPPDYALPARATDRMAYAAFLHTVVVPTAQYCGLWHQRNIADDAALLLRDADRFCEVIDWAARHTESGAHQADAVRTALNHGSTIVSVAWAWHHVATIDRVVSPDWDISALARAGFVAVECETDEACYQTLGVVHANFNYREASQLRDYRGESTLTGYRTIHTVVGGDATTEQIAVRITSTADASPTRFRSIDEESLGRLTRLRPNAGSQQIVVFTPRGLPVSLPIGSTVLNFARKLHCDLPVLVRGARIGREDVGLLRPLTPGDVVWLDVTNTPRTLPKDWERYVPPSTHKELRDAERSTLNKVLPQRGRLWVREQLLREGYRNVLEDAEIDQIVQAMVDRLVATLVVDREADRRNPESDWVRKHFLEQEKGPARLASWWLRQLGALDAIDNGAVLPLGAGTDADARRWPAEIRPWLRKRIVRAVEARRMARGIEAGAPLSPELFDYVDCASCAPRDGEGSLGSLSAKLEVDAVGRPVIVVHRRDTPCANGATPVESPPSSRTALFLLIEGTDRAGLATEVLSAVNQHKIGIVDIVARRIDQPTDRLRPIPNGASPGRGLIRLRLDPVDPTTLDVIRRRIQDINGVARVTKASDAETEQERAHLWPRRLPRAASGGQLPAPLICGSVIDQDVHFYGMRSELATLAQVYDRAARSAGAHAFVTGPLRWGKSSLVEAFFRELHGMAVPCTSVRLDALPGHTWPKFADELRDRLVEKAKERASALGKALSPTVASAPSLIHAIDAVRTTLGGTVALAIDEATRLLLDTQYSRVPQDLKKLFHFRDWVLRTPGVMLIWVGPSAPVRNLRPDVYELLRAREIIDIKPATEAETSEMTAVAHLDHRYRIELPESVAKDLHRWTAGNRYWTAAVANEMWRAKMAGGTATAEHRENTQSNGDPIVYDAKLLVDAIGVVSKCDYLFLDRWRQDSWSKKQHSTAISVLRLLAERAGGGPRPSVSGMTQDEITHELRSAARVDVGVLEDLLSELEERGAVAAEGGPSAARWSIAAPLLGRYILHYAKRLLGPVAADTKAARRSSSVVRQGIEP